MKLFWAFIAMLVLAAGAFAIWPSGGAGDGRRADEAVPDADVQPAAADPGEAPAAAPLPSPTRDFSAMAAPMEPAAPVTAPGDAPVDLAGAPESEPVDPASAIPEAETPAEPAVAVTPADPALPAPLDEMMKESLATTEAPAEAVPAEAAPAAPAAPAEAAPAAAPKIVVQADGSQLIDDRFILRGDGTREKPYEVTWDFLMSAQEVYKPRLGQKTLPAYLDIVDGKYVKLAGYIAFPLMAESPDEMLIMLNQWDGCCIGVPPTPYDAIEVRLNDAAEGETRFKVSGSLTGRIAVDPYLVKDWLIGLYTMDDAVLTTEN